MAQQPTNETENVSMRVEGSKLILEIDLDTRLRPSSTGKTLLIAKCNGKIPGRQESVSLTAYAKDR